MDTQHPTSALGIGCPLTQGSVLRIPHNWLMIDFPHHTQMVGTENLPQRPHPVRSMPASLTECPHNLYFEEDASMEASSGLNPASSQGFLEVSSVEPRAVPPQAPLGVLGTKNLLGYGGAFRRLFERVGSPRDRPSLDEVRVPTTPIFYST